MRFDVAAAVADDVVDGEQQLVDDIVVEYGCVVAHHSTGTDGDGLWLMVVVVGSDYFVVVGSIVVVVVDNAAAGCSEFVAAVADDAGNAGDDDVVVASQVAVVSLAVVALLYRVKTLQTCKKVNHKK